MKQNPKTKVQPERDKMQKGLKSPDNSQQSATHDLATLSRTDIQDMSREDILALQQTIGNQAVARLLAQRQEELPEEEL